MKVEDTAALHTQQNSHRTQKDLHVIDPKDLKALLYVGIRGDLALPIEDHAVDTFA